MKYGLHSVVNTVWMLLADAALMRSRGRTAARIASVLAHSGIRCPFEGCLHRHASCMRRNEGRMAAHPHNDIIGVQITSPFGGAILFFWVASAVPKSHVCQYAMSA